jgi:hypothetical protein
MTHIQVEDQLQTYCLKQKVKRIIYDELHRIKGWWFVTFHYRDNHTRENELLKDVADLKRKMHRIIYKSRDMTVKGAGQYPYPKMLFIHETSRQGTGQLHTHLIIEKMPPSLNTQYEMENLFHKRLPYRVKALSKWKSINIQRINPDEPDYRRISNYLGKQTNLEGIALDPFNSDLSPKQNEKKSTHHYVPRKRCPATPSDPASTKKDPLSERFSVLQEGNCRKIGATSEGGGCQVKTITIRLPDVEAAMLLEVQKTNKAFRDLQGLVLNQIRQEYLKRNSS